MDVCRSVVVVMFDSTIDALLILFSLLQETIAVKVITIDRCRKTWLKVCGVITIIPLTLINAQYGLRHFSAV